MRTYYQGPTYTVEYTDADTACFTRHTDTPPGVVTGHGAFVFDTLSGDVVNRKGSARGRTDMEWLAFSQDAQDQARAELERQGVVVNPYDFGCEMPEIASPKKSERMRGHVIAMGNPGLPHVPPGTAGVIRNVDEDNVIYVDWENGASGSVLPTDVEVESNPAKISRTRGVKTMRGPYSAKKGYKPWIQRRGKLGEGFLTTMTKKERRAALDRCVRAYGYRSCLGSIMALERAKRGPRGVGEGVGVKYAKKLKDSRDYLRETYGGPGSYKREEKPRKRAGRAAEAGPGYTVNPTAEEHGARAKAFIKEGSRVMRRAEYHSKQFRETGDARELDLACGYARDAHRYGVLAEHELFDADFPPEKAEAGKELAAKLKTAAVAHLNELDCAWTE